MGTCARRQLRTIAATKALIWLAVAVGLWLAAPLAAAAGTNVVLGDSNSVPGVTPWLSWPELLFGDDFIDRSVGGTTTYDRVGDCTPEECWWIEGTSVDDTWWIMLGTNDVVQYPESTPEIYAENMLAIIAEIPALDIRLISSPRTSSTFTGGRNQKLDQQAHVDLLICEHLPHVTCAGDLGDVLLRPDHYFDIYHMNAEGHRAVAAFLAIPEPGTGTLALAGLGALGWCRRAAPRRPAS